ncbi:MAG: ExeA family protein [Planctomyces sp.]
MYESHFGFHRTPFQSFDPARLFIRSESIGEILPRLLRCVRSSLGMALVTSVQGTGRTALLKYLRQELQNEGRTVLVSGAALDSSATLLNLLMHSAVRHAGGAALPEQSLLSCTQWNTVECLRRSMDFWGPVILLLDDAHLAPLSVLNELRAVSEEEWNGRSLVRVLATAPVSFEIDLARSEYSCFSHRIRCHEVLQSLTVKECVEYLQRHLEAVGGRLAEVFTEEAVNRLVEACDGLPRSLSMLADETLAVAAEQSLKPANLTCVGLALKRLQHLACRLNASLAAESVSVEHGWESEEAVSEKFDPAGARGFVVTATSLPERPLAGVVEFGERSGFSVQKPVSDSLPSDAVEFFAGGDVGDFETLDPDAEAVDVDASTSLLHDRTDQPLRPEPAVEMGAEPVDFSSWVPIPAHYTWVESSVADLPAESWPVNPVSAIPRSMSIDIQSVDDDEILRLMSERRRVSEPVVEILTEQVSDLAAELPPAVPQESAGDTGEESRSPLRSVENRRDIFGGFQDVSPIVADVAARTESEPRSIPRSLGTPTVYSGEPADETVGTSVEQTSEDRFATLFTRLRKLRSEKAGVLPGAPSAIAEQARQDH